MELKKEYIHSDKCETCGSTKCCEHCTIWMGCPGGKQNRTTRRKMSSSVRRGEFELKENDCLLIKSFPRGHNNYRKKPVVIQAIKIMTTFTVETKEGLMMGKKGDYLIRGVKGELYPCDKTIFHETYDEVK